MSPDDPQFPDGYAVAAGLGAEAFFDEGGDDGRVYFLEDGRVMKITGSVAEAAVSLRLKDIQADGLVHPSVPVIMDVFWRRRMIDCSDIGIQEPVPCVEYVILREAFDDLDVEDITAWHAALSHIQHVREGIVKSSLDDAFEIPGVDPLILRQVLDGLEWVEQHTGVRIRDIRPPNIGVGCHGMAGMRDMSRAHVPDALIKRVLDLDFSELPPSELPVADLSGYVAPQP